MGKRTAFILVAMLGVTAIVLLGSPTEAHAGAGCNNNGSCQGAETALSCPADCPASCGDGACTHAEDVCTCAADCGGAVCGDGCCSGTEDSCVCPGDCGGAVCGDGCCNGGENGATCSDCAICGNGFCDMGETVAGCPGDCAVAVCPNAICEASENNCNCAADCAVVCGDSCCSATEDPMVCADCAICGNGSCEAGEPATCPVDCCGDAVCGAGEGGVCPADCCGNAVCDSGESNASCPADCTVSVCGNAICEGGEDNVSCAADCIVGCGNLTCDVGETNANCPTDCPAYCGNGSCEFAENSDNCCDDCGSCPGPFNGNQCGTIPWSPIACTGSYCYMPGPGGFCGSGMSTTCATGSGDPTILGPPEAPIVKPNIIFLIESGADMMYADDTATLPICNPFNPVAVNERSKWLDIVEALTGSFVDYSCQLKPRAVSTFDSSETVPYVAAIGSAQLDNGLLDLYGGLIKPGYMSFDTVPSKNSGVLGMFSFGGTYGGNSVGIRDAAADDGAIISVGLDTKDNMLLRNAALQAEILCTTPAGEWAGSTGDVPLAPAMIDLKAWFRNTNDVAPPPSSGSMLGFDPQHACREKGNVMIVDGYSTYYANYEDGYPFTPAEAADDLYAGSFANGDALEIKTFVLAHKAPAGDIPLLDDIAIAGHTDAALVSSTGAEFKGNLAKVIARLINATTSRSVPAITNRTNLASAAQFEFSGGMEIGALAAGGGLPWRGILARTTWVCDPGTLIASSTEDLDSDGEDDDFGLLLTARVAARDLVTVDSGGSTIAFDNSIPEADFGLSTTTERDFLVDWVHGLTPARSDRKLGDIYNSNPVINTPPNLDLPLASYTLFKAYAGVKSRPTMVYAGSNDGILHAFDATTGDERWGYVPRVLFPVLNNQINGHVFLADGPPVVREVPTRVYTTDDPTIPAQNRWMTALVAGMGAGARGVVALDVTDPTDSSTMTPLWELTPSDEPRLGYVVGTPVIGIIDHNGTGQVPSGAQRIGVAIIPGGLPLTASAPVGEAVFVRAIDDGSEIFTFDNTTTCAGETESFNAPITGSIAAFNDFTGSSITRFFAGDSLGRLWRFEVSSHDTNDWCQTAFTPAAYMNGQSIWAAPTLALNDLNELVVIYGTGNISQLVQGGAYNHVFSFTENITRDPATGIITSVVADPNWVIALPNEGEKVTGAPVVFDGCAYWATFAPHISTQPGDCSFGNGYLWGVKFDGNDGLITDPTACFDGDGDPLTEDPVDFFLLPDKAISFGVNIARRPACFETETIPDPDPAAAPGDTVTRITNFTASSFELTAHIGVASGSTAAAGVNKISRTLRPPSAPGLALSWADIFD